MILPPPPDGTDMLSVPAFAPPLKLLVAVMLFVAPVMPLKTVQLAVEAAPTAIVEVGLPMIMI